MKTLVKKILAVFIGVCLMGMGAAISIINHLGADPVTMFTQGLSFRLQDLGLHFFTVGNALITLNLLVFIVLLLIYKMRFVNIGTFAGMICVGIFIDMWIKLLLPIVTSNNWVCKIIWVIVGTTILAVGIGTYISTDMGASPLDLISVTISERFNFNYSKTRMICDLLFMIFGWVLGGIIGISTVLCIVLVGPISGWIIKFLKKYY